MRYAKIKAILLAILAPEVLLYILMNGCFCSVRALICCQIWWLLGKCFEHIFWDTSIHVTICSCNASQKAEYCCNALIFQVMMVMSSFINLQCSILSWSVTQNMRPTHQGKKGWINLCNIISKTVKWQHLDLQCWDQLCWN